MHPWPAPAVPRLPGCGSRVALRSTPTGLVTPLAADGTVRMYVCGITPYDATHIGHAATYTMFDVLGRVLRDSGARVRYVQNVTDVDDPLLERAAATGVDWRELGADQIALFFEDMTALAVLPPDVYVGVVESMPVIVDAVTRLLEAGLAYRLGPLGDVYHSVATDPAFGSVAGLDRAAMVAAFAEAGGDPQREGKRDPLDSLLWRAERAGEPSWDGGPLGRGRPGWHVECAALAIEHLGVPLDVQGGGADLAFPHHEMSASIARGLSGAEYARVYAHGGLVGLDGEKMSKSRGNLVFVSALRSAGADPAAIRLALLARHYSADWEWTSAGLDAATTRIERWRDAVSRNDGPPPTACLAAMRQRLAADLDTPGALTAVDEWVARQQAVGGTEPGAPGVVARAVDALLGVRL